MPNIQRITPCLWFDDQAEEAAKTYVAIFSNSRIMSITRYGEAGHEVHGIPGRFSFNIEFGYPRTTI